MYGKILIANDGSEGALKALGCAIELAERLGVELHMVSVEELPRFSNSIDELVEEQAEAERRFEKVVAHAQTKAAMHNIDLKTHVIIGHPVSRIVEFISNGHYDLLVIGYMGHSALYNHLIGSTTDRLVRLAPCSVMVAK